ncbi:MAG: HNH endonuclease domain-containing protein [Bacteroidota bacterium]|nr:hypothetical protein [Odoribacter sp.]MDP3644523.1 HNH endonuclease domain-containing protein [Bacteroidota bacterium]
MSETLGIDLGTNSIGLTKRNSELGNNIVDQLEYFSSIIFNKGVGIGKSGEFSYAAERTKNRSTRRLYQARKYRIWETLDVLMKYGFCPITEGELNQWRKYDKAKGLKRQYPIGAIKFELWVRLDFNGNGVVDYSSPYQLRAELATKQFDFSKETDKFKFGRALYHIAQRRGFKSSKGETLKEQEKEAEEKNLAPDIEIQIDLKKSEEKKSKDLIAYQEENKLSTVGCCFYQLEKEGVRIRASKYQAVRSQYEKEIEYIFTFQNELQIDSDFYRAIHKAIFYKRPLRSQKGLVGKCTLEPTKERCPISHPDFEEFRGWSFINNIKYKKNPSDDWSELTKDQKQQLFNDKFLRTTSNFKFEEIRNWLEKKMGFYLLYDTKTINYKDKTNVAGCPISGRLRNLLGDDWRNFTKHTSKSRLNKKTGEFHPISYSMDDIWHVCFSFEDEERIVEFAKNALLFNEKETKSLVNLWVAIPQGYSMLSLKAIRNINKFLKKGLIYTDAVLLAKLPEILGNQIWKEKEELFLDEIGKLTAQNRDDKRIINVVNNLIANYKSLELDEQFAYKNNDYRLDGSDFKEIEKFTIESYGEKSWEKLPQPEKDNQLSLVAAIYQQYFSSSKRDFYRLPKLGDTIKKYLSDNYSVLSCPSSFIDKETKLPCQCCACKKLNLLYHPSQIEFYKPAKEQTIEWNGTNLSLKLLESPKIGAFKNPMAIRTLHEMRKAINHLLKEGIITEDTRIVVETARDLNDANMRWAIEAYQREREKENKEFEAVIRDLYNNTDRTITNDEIDKARILIDQYEISEKGEIKIVEDQQKSKKKLIEKAEKYSKDVTKYRLWLEQGCRCIYTGKIINITDLFSDGRVDFEHTIPRSISFDNSLANLTVCDAHFNRSVKKNQIPSQLSNYDDILLRIQPWKEKVEKLKDNVDFWRAKAKKAQEKTIKDNAIRQRHLWQMELDYWQNKVDRFKMEEVTSGFKNSQLVDTRIITKYATHYLKSVFNNVEVQKGSVTANFRKMLGVQSIDEKKSRDKHSHHAIDAAVLTLIPPAAKRDKMLKLFYEIDEKELFENVDQLKYELEKERKNCQLGNVSGISQFIEENILINHIAKDQTLTPANRKARKRGKEIFVKDKNGNEVTKWITGDCIRGQLHKDSLFGGIKYPLKDSSGIFQKNEMGQFQYPIDKEGCEVISMVKRELITSFKAEKDLEKIIDPNVKLSIDNTIQKRKEEGKSFATAIAEPIWMLDNKGKEKRIDRNGKHLSPIRHVRCRVAAGKGFFTKDKALEIKKQTYISAKKSFHLDNRDYKQSYYAQNDGNYLCLLYEGINKGKVERKFKLINYFEIAHLQIYNTNQLWNEPFYKEIEDKKKTFSLSAIIKVGTRVLLWSNDPSELADLSSSDLLKRLFVVYKYNSVGIEYIYMQNHIESRPDNELDAGDTSFDNLNYQPRVMLTANKFNCLIEHRDFIITPVGKIEYL